MKGRLITIVLLLWLYCNLFLLIAGWSLRGYLLYKVIQFDAYQDWSGEWVKAGTRITSRVNYIFPLDANGISDYDITEFMLVGLMPLLIYFSIKYIRGKRFQ